MHPERITLKDKEFVNDLNYDRVEIAEKKKKRFSKVETKNRILL